MFVDSHAHLDFEWFNEDREDVIERAKKAGVQQIVNSGDDLESSRRVLALAKKYPDFMRATLGVHPTRAMSWGAEVYKIFVQLIREDKQGLIVGIGETGLDFFREGASKEVQEKAFREQIKLAMEFDLPVVVHCREAFLDTLAILEEMMPTQVMFHCYTGNLEMAKRIWAHGWVTSFSGIITYPKNEELRECVRQAPEGQFTIETDAPFLPPQSKRGERNESAYVVEIGEFVMSLRGEVNLPYLDFLQRTS